MTASWCSRHSAGTACTITCWSQMTKSIAITASGTASDGNDFVLYETDTGKLFYDADGNGAGAAVQIATLSTGLALTEAIMQRHRAQLSLGEELAFRWIITHHGFERGHLIRCERAVLMTHEQVKKIGVVHEADSV